MASIMIDKEQILNDLFYVTEYPVGLDEVIVEIYSELIEMSIHAVLDIARYNGWVYYHGDLRINTYMPYDLNSFLNAIRDIHGNIAIEDVRIRNVLRLIFNSLPELSFILEKYGVVPNDFKIVETKTLFLIM